jgi:hypothetical protein
VTAYRSCFGCVLKHGSIGYNNNNNNNNNNNDNSTLTKNLFERFGGPVKGHFLLSHLSFSILYPTNVTLFHHS